MPWRLGCWRLTDLMGPCLFNSLKVAGLVSVRRAGAGERYAVYRVKVYGRDEMRYGYGYGYGTERYDTILGPAPCVRACVRAAVRTGVGLQENGERFCCGGVERGAPAPGPAPGSAQLTAGGSCPPAVRCSSQGQGYGQAGTGWGHRRLTSVAAVHGSGPPFSWID